MKSNFMQATFAPLNYVSALLKRIAVVVTILVLSNALGWGQSIFNNPITGTNPNTSNPYTTGQTVDTGITVTGIGRGTVTSANANDRYTATGWNTVALDATHYFQWTLTPNSGKKINFVSLVYTGQASGTGPTSAALRSSADGFAANIGSATITGTTISLSAPAYQNVTAAITFRLYGFGASASGGTFSVNDFTFNGTVASAVTPIISTSGTPLSAVHTTYGTASALPTSFSVSGADMAAGILVTPPAGFEVSLSSGSGYAGSITVGAAGTIVSTTVFVRLAATTVVGAYSGNIVCSSSGGAASVNVATVSSSVSPKALTVTASAQSKTYGTALSLGTSLFTSSGLENSETIGAVTLSASGGTAATDAATTYTITPSAATGGTFTAGNYSITYATGTLTVNPKALTITANSVTKPFGNTLASPVTGSSAFTSVGLANSETIGSVTITYGTGAAPGDAAGSYPNQVTPSAALPGTFTPANYSISYVSATLTVTADPTISTSGTLTAVDTIYGTASPTPTTFSVSGIFLTGDLTVTPPSGFEVSLSSGSGYTTSLTVPASGTLASTPIYVRLAATTGFGTYSGNVTISGGGAASQTVATASSSVAKKALTISGLNGSNKVYDRTTTASFTGTPAYVGLENAETFSVSGSPSATFASFTIGTAKPITVTGYTAPSANYSLTQPTGLTGNITPLALTVTGAGITNKVYTGDTVATITNATLVGVISPDVVTIATSTGTFADANVGTAIAVTAALTLGGANATNYSITQPTGLTGNITIASQTITFAALADKTTSDAPFALTGTASSGLTVTYVSSTPAVATVSGSTVTIVGVGSTTITASQAGNGNYSAASDVARTLTVAAPLVAGWDFQTTSGGGTAVAAAPGSPTTYFANFGSGTIYLDGSFGSSAWTSLASNPQLTAFAGTAVNAASGFSTTTITPASLAVANSSANGQKIVFKFSMASKFGLVVSYATQGTASGFTSHFWEYSTDGTTWTTAETVPSIPLSFATKTLATITGLNGASTAYLRLTVSGATTTTGNNRLDNIQIRAQNAVAVTLSGSKVYDGSTTVPAAALTVVNNVDGANLTLSGSVTLSSASGGLQTISSFAGLTLGGSAAGNYTLTGASGSVRINPAPGTISMVTTKNTPANLWTNKLVLIASDAGVVLSVTGVTSPTAHGTAAIVGTNIVYTPATDYTGADSISYTLSDDAGGFSTGTVSVTVNEPNVSSTITDLDVTTDPGHVILTASGAASTTYKIQVSDDSGGTWSAYASPYGTATTGANGILTFTDTAPNYPSRFYRLAQ